MSVFFRLGSFVYMILILMALYKGDMALARTFFMFQLLMLIVSNQYKIMEDK